MDKINRNYYFYFDYCTKLVPEKGKYWSFNLYTGCEEYLINCEDAGSNCNSNIPLGSNLKCIYKKGECTKPKYCSDFNNKLHETFDCQKLSPVKDDNKACIYFNGKCEEHYRKCEDYKGTNQKECEDIIPIYEDDFDFAKKCVFNHGTNKCEKKTRLCSDYKKGQDSNFCTKAKDNNNNECALYGDICREKYNNCEDYKGNSKEICESIFPKENTYSKKCVFKEKQCISEPMKCSDTNDEDNCYDIILSDSKMNV